MQAALQKLGAPLHQHTAKDGKEFWGYTSDAKCNMGRLGVAWPLHHFPGWQGLRGHQKSLLRLRWWVNTAMRSQHPFGTQLCRWFSVLKHT